MNSCTTPDIDTSSIEELDFEPTCEVVWIKTFTGEITEKCSNRADYDAIWLGHVRNHEWIHKFVCQKCVDRAIRIAKIRIQTCQECAAFPQHFKSLIPLR